jgi:adenosine deaminase
MISVSVDGYMDGPNHEFDWHMVDDELHRHLNGWLVPALSSKVGPRTS